MLSHKNTKNANFLFIVDMLEDLLAQELITDREYARAKKYYMRLTGADIVLVSSPLCNRSNLLFHECFVGYFIRFTV